MTAALLIDLAGWWLWAGAAVSLIFLTVGIDQIDEDAQGAYVFRPLLVPAILLLWPLVLWMWLRKASGAVKWQSRYSPPRAAHGAAAVVMGVAIVVALVAGVTIRQTWPADIAPVQLTAPEDPS